MKKSASPETQPPKSSNIPEQESLRRAGKETVQAAVTGSLDQFISTLQAFHNPTECKNPKSTDPLSSQSEPLQLEDAVKIIWESVSVEAEKGAKQSCSEAADILRALRQSQAKKPTK